MSDDRLAALSAAGVSIWLDDLDRGRLAGGGLAELVGRLARRRGHDQPVDLREGDRRRRRGVRRPGARPRRARRGARRGRARDDDLRRALGLRRPRRRATGAPAASTAGCRSRSTRGSRAATDATIAEAKALHWAVDRPNVLIKIPATVEGLPAITAVLGAGHQRQRHADLLRRPLPRRASTPGSPVSSRPRPTATTCRTIESVASFFVCRVDTEVDKRLGSRTPTLRGHGRHRERAAGARGLHRGPRHRRGGRRWPPQGAHVQRPLWASTGVKDPAYDDTRYVVDLVTTDVVNTMPEATLDAVARPRRSSGATRSSREYAAAHAALDALDGRRHRPRRRGAGARGRGRRQVRGLVGPAARERHRGTGRGAAGRGLTGHDVRTRIWTPTDNPLRDPRDRRLPTIAGPCSLVIFGVTGDLARKKLMPAVYDLANRGLLPPGFALVGFARRDWADQDFAADRPRLGPRARTHRVPRGRLERAVQGHPLRRRRLRRRRRRSTRSSRPSLDLDRVRGTQGNHAFYLSIPPKFFGDVVQQLKRSGLSVSQNGAWRRVVIEKPFGHDLESARELNAHDRRGLPVGLGVPHRPLPRQGDGAEPAGAAVRQHDVRADLEQQLRRPRADHHGRGHRHRRPRRLLRRHRRRPRRDPEPPAPAAGPDRDGGAAQLRGARRARREGEGARRHHAAEGPRPAHRARAVRRRLAGRHAGDRLPAGGRHLLRRRRPRPSPPSGWTSTPAAGPGVPFYLRTGKRLGRRVTELAIVLQARRRTCPSAPPTPRSSARTRWCVRIQPDEGVTLRFGSKVPGTQMEVRDVNMDFAYGDSFTESSPEAYERLILDVLLGDPPLFPRHEEVELGWKILDPILEHWAEPAVSPSSTSPAPGAPPRRTRCSPATGAAGGGHERASGRHDGRRRSARAISAERFRQGSSAVGRVLTLVIIADEATRRPTPCAQPPRRPASTRAASSPRSRGPAAAPRGSTPRSRWAAATASASSSSCGCAAPSSHHVASVVLPLLVPDAPVVVWWPGNAPEVPGRRPGGPARAAPHHRRRGRRPGRWSPCRRARPRYRAGDTDLAWTRITPWRALHRRLARPAVRPDHRCHGLRPERTTRPARCSPPGCSTGSASLSRRRAPAGRASPGVDLHTKHGDIRITRPDGRRGHRVAARLPGPRGGAARRTTEGLIAEELRRLDPDDIYGETLAAARARRPRPPAKRRGEGRPRSRVPKATAPAKAARAEAPRRREGPAKPPARRQEGGPMSTPEVLVHRDPAPQWPRPSRPGS